MPCSGVLTAPHHKGRVARSILYRSEHAKDKDSDASFYFTLG